MSDLKSDRSSNIKSMFQPLDRTQAPKFITNHGKCRRCKISSELTVNLLFAKKLDMT